MDHRRMTTEQAQGLIDERIEQFGLGALPRVRVMRCFDGRWRVQWDGEERFVAPMTEAQWTAWLERHVGPVDPERLQTTEG